MKTTVNLSKCLREATRTTRTSLIMEGLIMVGLIMEGLIMEGLIMEGLILEVMKGLILEGLIMEGLIMGGLIMELNLDQDGDQDVAVECHLQPQLLLLLVAICQMRSL